MYEQDHPQLPLPPCHGHVALVVLALDLDLFALHSFKRLVCPCMDSIIYGMRSFGPMHPAFGCSFS